VVREARRARAARARWAGHRGPVIVVGVRAGSGSEACGYGHGASARGSGRLARAAWAGAIAACGLLGAAHLAAFAGSLAGASLAELPAAVSAALAGALLGALAADFTTGLVHWACDSYGSERTPLLGAGLIRGFREHHRRPRAVLASDAIDANGQAAVAVALALGVAALPPLRGLLAAHPFAYALGLALCAVSGLGNQLHQWAHTPAAPRFVRRLQRGGWVLSPRAHARHHLPPHASAYCTATGWCNPPLDALGFWRALERLVERVCGAAPRGDAAGRRP